MVTFIKQYHPHGAGIVYTYSRKDADQVANSLCEYGIIARVSLLGVFSFSKRLILVVLY